MQIFIKILLDYLLRMELIYLISDELFITYAQGTINYIAYLILKINEYDIKKKEINFFLNNSKEVINNE